MSTDARAHIREFFLVLLLAVRRRFLRTSFLYSDCFAEELSPLVLLPNRCKLAAFDADCLAVHDLFRCEGVRRKKVFFFSLPFFFRLRRSRYSISTPALCLLCRVAGNKCAESGKNIARSKGGQGANFLHETVRLSEFYRDRANVFGIFFLNPRFMPRAMPCCLLVSRNVESLGRLAGAVNALPDHKRQQFRHG